MEEKNIIIKKSGSSKYVEIPVKIRIYFDVMGISENTETVTLNDINRGINRQERIDLGEEVLNRIKAENVIREN